MIGPGDAVRVYFDTSIDCVQKLWNGSPQAVATATDGTPVPLVATACKDSWGGSMSVKSSQQHTSPTLWADLKLPTDAALAGKTLNLTVTMPVRYPTMGGGNAFVDGATTATLTRELKLSSAGTGHTYWLTFWAMVGGSVLLAVAGLMLSRGAAALKAAAPDTRVTPIRETDEESADYRRRGEDEEDDRPRRRPLRDEDEGDWKK